MFFFFKVTWHHEIYMYGPPRALLDALPISSGTSWPSSHGESPSPASQERVRGPRDPKPLSCAAGEGGAKRRVRVRLFARLARQPTHPSTQPSPASQEGLDATTLDSGLPPDPEPPWPPLPDTSSDRKSTPAPATGSRAQTPSTRAPLQKSSTPTRP